MWAQAFSRCSGVRGLYWGFRSPVLEITMGILSLLLSLFEACQIGGSHGQNEVLAGLIGQFETLLDDALNHIHFGHIVTSRNISNFLLLRPLLGFGKIKSKGADIVKLNTECIRDILLEIEKQQRITIDEDNNVIFEMLWVEDLYKSLSDYTKEDIFYALHNLDQAGYVKTNLISGDDVLAMYGINYITYEGHNFLDKIRDPKAWKYVKNAGAAIGNMSLAVINQVANGVTTAFIDSYLKGNVIRL